MTGSGVFLPSGFLPGSDSFGAMNRPTPAPFSPPPAPSVGWPSLGILIALIAMELTAIVGLALR